jgi:hypothetical protein
MFTPDQFRPNRTALPGTAVFALWQRDELIYLGRSKSSSTIKEALLAHLARRHACTAKATHYA